MPRPRRDITGQQFGYLTALSFFGYGKAGTFPAPLWRCRCSYNGCNNITIVVTNSLVRGATKSCGCLNRDLAAERCRVRNPKRKSQTGAEG